VQQNLRLLVAWWPGRCRDHRHCFPALTSSNSPAAGDMQGRCSKPDGDARVRSCLPSVTAINKASDAVLVYDGQNTDWLAGRGANLMCPLLDWGS
jgi:hypothetical protein